MWRSVLLGAVLAGVLAGCSLNGGSDNLAGPSSGDGIPQYGVIEGRVVTTACGGLLLSGGCGPTPYRGSLVFCTKMGQIGSVPIRTCRCDWALSDRAAEGASRSDSGAGERQRR